MVRLAWLVALICVGGCFTDERPGGGTSDTDNGSTSTPGPTTTGTSTTSTSTTSMPPTSSGPTSTTDPQTGTDSGVGSTGEPCIPDLQDDCPYCVEGACASCDALPDGCTALDPATPTCDTETGVCRGCLEHTECDSGACRMATGECFAMDNRLWVNLGATCAIGDGNQATPFCTIDEALASVGTQPGEDGWAVFVMGSTDQDYDISGNVTIPSRPLALIGPTNGAAATLTSDTGPVVQLPLDAETYIARVTMRTDFDGSFNVLCSAAADAWLHDVQMTYAQLGHLQIGTGCEIRAKRSAIDGSQLWGVEIQENGRLTFEQGRINNNYGGVRSLGNVSISRSYVHNNYVDGGLRIESGTLNLSNVSMSGNAYQIGHLWVAANASAQLTYVTAISTSGLDCEGPQSNYAIRNSIIESMVGCDNAGISIENSIITDSLSGFGATNISVNPATDYANIFEDHLGGDFHIRSVAPPFVSTVGMRTATDPDTDLEGNPRPDVDSPDAPGPFLP